METAQFLVHLLEVCKICSSDVFSIGMVEQLDPMDHRLLDDRRVTMLQSLRDRCLIERIDYGI